MSKFVPADSFNLVIFGATGDLAQRKLLPALFHRDCDDQFTADSRIIGASRSALSTEEYRQQVYQSLSKFVGIEKLTEERWQRFSERLVYCPLDITKGESWTTLREALKGSEEHTSVFYLATMPSLFGDTAQQISVAGLANDKARIVVEKPLGTDRASAQAINAKISQVFAEEQIYRIDHYLGKETVQNLLALRFANSLFEPIWDRASIDHVQITVAEKLGVGTRGSYYDKSGALKDMVQNHIIQLLCLVAMEPPASMHHDDIRNEKLKVLRALKQVAPDNVKRVTARGQYTSGAVDAEVVSGFLEELEPGSQSNTETFVAIKAEVENWRWSGTPFYLRTGKRMATKSSEIVVQFKPVAHNIFPNESGEMLANRLTIRLHPDEGVELSVMAKEPGPGGFRLRSLPLNLSFADVFQNRYPDAYERLLMEVFRGNPALFMRGDEVDAAWTWVDGIVDSWESKRMKAENYTAGSWGPKGSMVMLDRDDREWQND